MAADPNGWFQLDPPRLAQGKGCTYVFNIDLRMGMLQAPVVSGNVSSAQSPRIAYRTRGNRESPLRGD